MCVGRCETGRKAHTVKKSWWFAISGHRVLIFSTMTMLLDSVEEVLEWAGLEYLRLDGTTKSTERGELIHDFSTGKVWRSNKQTSGHCGTYFALISTGSLTPTTVHCAGTCDAAEHSIWWGMLYIALLHTSTGTKSCWVATVDDSGNSQVCVFAGWLESPGS